MQILLQENLSKYIHYVFKIKYKNWFEYSIIYINYSVSATLPSGQLSNVPWRRTGVKYTNNEAYFDVVEEVDAIIDRTGATVFAEIQGYVCSLFNIINTDSYIDKNICNILFKL